MGGGVDAAGEAGDDDEALGGEVGCEEFGEAAAVGRCVAGADEGDGAGLEDRGVAEDGDDRGRGFQEQEEGRIGRVVGEEDVAAEASDGVLFAAGFGFGGGVGRGGAAGFLSDEGQGVEGGFGGAEAGEEAAVGDGADAFGAGEAEAGEGHWIFERLAPMRGSVPASKRRMLAWWRARMSSVMRRVASA